MKKKNTKDCPLVLKENAAGILSVVNAAAVQLESFSTAQMKQLSTQFFSARGQPLVPLRLGHLLLFPAFPPIPSPVTSDQGPLGCVSFMHLRPVIKNRTENKPAKTKAERKTCITFCLRVSAFILSLLSAGSRTV